MGLADIVLATGQSARKADNQKQADIIEFIESAWGLDMRLYPVQKIILKAHYGIPLDDNDEGFDLTQPIPQDHPRYTELTDLNPDSMDYGYYRFRITVTDWRRQNPQYMSEAGYLRYLYDDGRCNIREVVPGEERREMVLSIGRRSGKTFIAAAIAAYETYKLLLKGSPQAYYGLPTSNNIQIISVATDKDQAGLLYQEASGHFRNCGFFLPYTANNTQTYARFQTPADISRYGRYADDPTAKATLKVTFRSCVAKGLRGAGNFVVILDEIAHFTDAGQSSADAVYNAVTPSTSTFSPKDPKDNRIPIGVVEGRVISISSPLGKQGMFYKLFQVGMRGGEAGKNMLCIQAPSWEVNPTIPASEFEKHYLKDSAVFFTEYGAEFSDRTRGWIEPPDLYACIDPTLRQTVVPPARRPHFIGIDVGLVGDGSAVAIGHIDGDRRVVLDFLDQIKAGEGKFANYPRLEFDDVVEWIYQLSRQFYFVHGMFDQWAGIPFEQALAKKGLRQLKSEHFTDQLNSELYRNFKDMMWNKSVVLFDDPIEPGHDHCAYIEELCELQAEYKSKYITKVAAPNTDGKHDDRSDALIRMVWLASQNMGTQKYISGGSSGSAVTSGRRSLNDSERAYRKAFLGARQIGSSPDRQVSRFFRGRIAGRR